MRDLDVTIARTSLCGYETDFFGIGWIGDIYDMHTGHIKRTETFVESAEIGIITLRPDVGNIRSTEPKIQVTYNIELR